MVVDYAREHYGLDCACASIEEFRCQKGTFDLIYSWGTSMNFADPFAVYDKIHGLLKEGGVFFMDFLDINHFASFVTKRKRRKAIHATCCPSRRGIDIAHRRIGYAESGFIPYHPFYSLSFIGTLLDARFIKKIGRWKLFDSLGVYAFVPGFYIFWARKQVQSP